MTPNQVAIYTRISNDPNVKRVGVARQRTDCEAIAASRWPDLTPCYYEDNDRSAYNGKRRPAFEQILDGIRDGRVRAVVAWDQDRLLRLPRELESLIDLCNTVSMGNLVTAQGDVDLTTHEGQFKARIMAAVAKKSSDDTSRRGRRAKADAKAAGLFLGGPVPYGSMVDSAGKLVPNPEHVAVIETVARDLLAGESLLAVVQRHVSEGGTGPHTPGGWRYLLTHSRWFDAKLAADVSALISNRRRPHATNTRKWWLTGILVCGGCGDTLHREATNRGISWRCPCKRTGGYHVAVLDERVEPYVREMLFAAAQVEREPEREVAPPPVDEGATERMDYLAAEFAAGRLTVSEWQAARAAVAPVEPPASVLIQHPPVDLRDVWHEMDPNQQHRAALQLVESVAVQPAGKGRFRDAHALDRLVPHWRQ